jgi:hypothetical protein
MSFKPNSSFWVWGEEQTQHHEEYSKNFLLTSSQLRVKSMTVKPGSDSGGVKVPRKGQGGLRDVWEGVLT